MEISEKIWKILFIIIWATAIIVDIYIVIQYQQLTDEALRGLLLYNVVGIAAAKLGDDDERKEQCPVHGTK
jgi:hypothetical protein